MEFGDSGELGDNRPLKEPRESVFFHRAQLFWLGPIRVNNAHFLYIHYCSEPVLLTGINASQSWSLYTMLKRMEARVDTIEKNLEIMRSDWAD